MCNTAVLYRFLILIPANSNELITSKLPSLCMVIFSSLYYGVIGTLDKLEFGLCHADNIVDVDELL